MYSVKKNVLQTVALLKAHAIKHIVVSPGSRNSPLLESFSQDSFFHCHLIVDERNAGFHALGIIQALQQPVALCCTSGTALLNYHPAVAEAYYQGYLPLVVLSADRAPHWIAQMDGQTVPQANVFGTLVEQSVNLPEIHTPDDEWYCNRLINEALTACIQCQRPVHINIPIDEPLFDYSQNELPAVRKINHTMATKQVAIAPFAKEWNALPKRMIVVGQLPPAVAKTILPALEKLAAKANCVILCEHITNCNSSSFTGNFDAILYTLSAAEKENFAPDLLITFGGHILSKRLKELIRQNKPKEHWHLSVDNKIIDLYQSLTHLVETDINHFLIQLEQDTVHEKNNYCTQWHQQSDALSQPNTHIRWSDIYVTGQFLQHLPPQSHLHLANSSMVRNAQLYRIHGSIAVYCNRGTNGIESSLPTAMGFASVGTQPIYLMIGDLSFLYTLGALWNMESYPNLRILVINNGGGGIFHSLPGLRQASSLHQYVSASHNTQLKEWAAAANINYLCANTKEELTPCLHSFFDVSTNKSIILEVITDIGISADVLQTYYQTLLKP